MEKEPTAEEIMERLKAAYKQGHFDGSMDAKYDDSFLTPTRPVEDKGYCPVCNAPTGMCKCYERVKEMAKESWTPTPDKEMRDNPKWQKGMKKATGKDFSTPDKEREPQGWEEGITADDMKWINEIVDNHKRIRNEGTRDRVRLLMQAAFAKALERVASSRSRLIEEVERMIGRIGKRPEYDEALMDVIDLLRKDK